jgi:predicted DNA-binding transcriptional regulator AlpA
MSNLEPPKKSAAAIARTIEQFDTLPDDARVRVPVVAAIYGQSVASTWRHARAGLIPKPLKTGPRATTWRVGDLREHLASFRKAA